MAWECRLSASFLMRSSNFSCFAIPADCTFNISTTLNLNFLYVLVHFRRSIFLMWLCSWHNNSCFFLLGLTGYLASWLSSWCLILLGFENWIWPTLNLSSFSWKACLTAWTTSPEAQPTVSLGTSTLTTPPWRRTTPSTSEWRRGPKSHRATRPCRNPRPPQQLLLWSPLRPAPPFTAKWCFRTTDSSSCKTKARPDASSSRRSSCGPLDSSSTAWGKFPEIHLVGLPEGSPPHQHLTEGPLTELAYHSRCWKPKTCFRVLLANSETSLPHTDPVLVRHLKHCLRQQRKTVHLLFQLRDRKISRHWIHRRFQDQMYFRHRKNDYNTDVHIQMANFSSTAASTSDKRKKVWPVTQDVCLSIWTTTSLLSNKLGANLL